MTKLSHSLLLFCILLLGFSACNDDDGPNNPVIGTVADVVAMEPDFSTLAAALQRTGLNAELSFPNAVYTVFAPTNAAFTAAGIDVNTISVAKLRGILSYHVINGSLLRVNKDEFTEGDAVLNTFNRTAPGENALPLRVNRTGAAVTLNDSISVVSADRIVTNGVIHSIDRLLDPPSIVTRARDDGRFTVLLRALDKAGLTQTLSDSGSYTVFAPTDDAFAASGITIEGTSKEALADLLLYHVVNTGLQASDIGGGMTYRTTLNTSGPKDSPLSLSLTNAGDSIRVNSSAKVVVRDVFANNGAVFAIDRLLAKQSVVDFVVMAPALDSLQGALTTAGLVDDLMGDGPFTVLAPNNGAFVAAKDTVAKLSMAQLIEVLTYHVIEDNVRAEDITAGDVKTLNGQTISVVINKDVDGSDLAPVLIAQDSTQAAFIINDIQGTNGVIHIIDKLLLPKLN